MWEGIEAEDEKQKLKSLYFMEAFTRIYFK
jgi:hypothetical protein